MRLKLTILGSGTSHGVPMIACTCPVCTSSDPRDRRTRCSVVFSWTGGALLVDTAPELRLQCLANDVDRVDAVFYTHGHADHVVGLDDLRRFNAVLGRDLPVYGSAETLDRLQRMFTYAFVDNPNYPSHKPRLTPMVVTDDFDVAGCQVTPLAYLHGETPVLGLRVGGIAYLPDCSFIPDATRERLRDLDVLVIDALRRRPHPTHFNLEQALVEAERIGARRTFLTHIAHELGHAEVEAELPSGVRMAYDGLLIESGG